MATSTPSFKFSENKLKADLSNYLDWSSHMRTYRMYYEVWEIVKEPAKDKAGKAAEVDSAKNIKAYLILEAQCEADTRRAYLQATESIAWKAWDSLSKTYLATTAIGKPYIRKQLRLLRLQDFEDMRSFIQKHKDLIRMYNEMAGAQALSEEEGTQDGGMVMREKDKIVMVEIVDLIYENLFKEWDEFLT